MCFLLVSHNLHWDREGNDCIRKLQWHCIQIMHLDIYSVGITVVCAVDVHTAYPPNSKFTHSSPVRKAL